MDHATQALNRYLEDQNALDIKHEAALKHQKECRIDPVKQYIDDIRNSADTLADICASMEADGVFTNLATLAYGNPMVLAFMFQKALTAAIEKYAKDCEFENDGLYDETYIKRDAPRRDQAIRNIEQYIEKQFGAWKS